MPAAPSAPAFVDTPVADPGAHADVADRYRWPWQGVRWSVGYVCFFLYLYTITSYQINLGQEMMITSILAITVSQTDRWTFPIPMALLTTFLAFAALGYHITEFALPGWSTLIDLAKVILIGLVAMSLLDDRPRIRFFVFAYLGLFALYPVRGAIFNYFLYHATEAGRVAWNNMFSNPNDFSSLMMFPISLALGVLATEKEKLLRLAALIGMALMPLAVFLTQSRGGIIALAIAGVIVFAGLRKNRIKLLAGALVVAAVVAVFAPKSVWTRLGALESATASGDLKAAEDQNSAAQRLELWRVAWKVTKEYPVTGVGWGAYPNANAKYGRRGEFDALAGGSRDAHNTYLTLLAETGILGTSIWLGAVLSFVALGFAALKRLRPIAPGYADQLKFVMVGLLAFGLAGIFGSFAHWSYTYIHLAALYAMAAQGLREAQVRPARLRRVR